MVFSMYRILNLYTLMFLYYNYKTIFEWHPVWSDQEFFQLVQHNHYKNTYSAPWPLIRNYNMICNSLGLYVMCILFSYFSKISRISKMVSVKYKFHCSYLAIAAYIICMSSLLLSCWRFSWCLVFGCLCQGFSLRSLLFGVKHVLLAISLLWVSN